MSDSKELQCYDYVNASYETVRNALAKDAVGTFHRATVTAEARARSAIANLSVKLGPIEVAADVEVSVAHTREIVAPNGDRTTQIELHWKAAKSPALFPTMDAKLSVYALSATETQLDFHGHYRPPLGFLGSAANALYGHRIAQLSVLKFLQSVASHLGAELHPTP